MGAPYFSKNITLCSLIKRTAHVFLHGHPLIWPIHPAGKGIQSALVCKYVVPGLPLIQQLIL